MLQNPTLVAVEKEVPISSIRQWIRDNNIDEIEAVIPDMTGIARGKLIPAQQVQ